MLIVFVIISFLSCHLFFCKIFLPVQYNFSFSLLSKTPGAAFLFIFFSVGRGGGGGKGS